MRFEFSHTHAYPGCKVRTSPSPGRTGASDCLVEFSDGVVVPARYTARAGAIDLHVSAYQTARGTRIVAKSWLLQPDEAQDRWRVKKRLLGKPSRPDGSTESQS